MKCQYCGCETDGLIFGLCEDCFQNGNRRNLVNNKYENFYGVTPDCPHLGIVGKSGNMSLFVYGKSMEDCYTYLDKYLDDNKVNKEVWIHNVGIKPHKPIPTPVQILEVLLTEGNTLVIFSKLYRQKGE